MKTKSLRIMLFVLWVPVWLFQAGILRAMGINPWAVGVFLQIELLIAGFWIIRLLMKAKEEARQADHAETRPSTSSLSAEADSYLDARRQERDGDLLAMLKEKTSAVAPAKTEGAWPKGL